MLQVASFRTNIPEGIQFQYVPGKGMGIFATKFFPEKTLIYQAKFVQVPHTDESYDYTIQIYDPTTTILLQEYQCNSYLHGVKYYDTRFLYGFDSFMNHDCHPNTFSTVKFNSLTYNTFALKDIAIGEEITCDYCTFDWECHGHSFDCSCAITTPNDHNNNNSFKNRCIGIVQGFKNLSLIEKIRRLPYIHEKLFQLFKEEFPQIIIYEIKDKERFGLPIQYHEEKDYYSISKADFIRYQLFPFEIDDWDADGIDELSEDSADRDIQGKTIILHFNSDDIYVLVDEGDEERE